MNILIFTGAGASVELGVPAMRQMAEQFREHIVDIKLPETVIEKINTLIDDESKDMEHAIDVIDRLEGGYNAQIEIGNKVDEKEIEPYKIIRQEAEWFVQHCCEKIKSDLAVRLWIPALRASQGLELTIATTNYDRAVEIAAARLKIPLCDGFEEFSGGEVANWRGFEDSNDIRLLKLHGSTNWYRGNVDQVFKLRHPMPLYGRLKITSDDSPSQPLQSALVLPSREKVVTANPFPIIAAEFRSYAKNADVAIFIGSSLRDPHMRDVFVSCTKSKPTFIISKTDDFAEGILPEKALVIKQSAGQFLISTLPKFLKEKDINILVTAAENGNKLESNALFWLASASDEIVIEKNRCSAIEKIANSNIELPKEEIEALLRDPSDEVSMFALGLIPMSTDREELVNLAKDIAKDAKGEGFKGELEILFLMKPGSDESPFYETGV